MCQLPCEVFSGRWKKYLFAGLHPDSVSQSPVSQAHKLGQDPFVDRTVQSHPFLVYPEAPRLHVRCFARLQERWRVRGVEQVEEAVEVAYQEEHSLLCSLLEQRAVRPQH